MSNAADKTCQGGKTFLFDSVCQKLSFSYVGVMTTF